MPPEKSAVESRSSDVRACQLDDRYGASTIIQALSAMESLKACSSDHRGSQNSGFGHGSAAQHLMLVMVLRVLSAPHAS